MSSLGAVGRIDWRIVGLVLALSAVSVLNLHSTSTATGTTVYLSQLYWLLLGIGVMAVVAAVEHRNLQRFAPIFWVLVMVLLTLVLIVGKEVNGSRDRKSTRLNSSH